MGDNESELVNVTGPPPGDEMAQLGQMQESMDALMANVNHFFLLIMAMVIFFMQCGFAFLEAGAVRSKNATNILIKNMLDAFIGGISYWVIGYALAFGEPSNTFCGYGFWASYAMPYSLFSHWFFHFVFAATAATIVSGSMAERCNFSAYFAYSIIITGLIYPIISHWAWTENGWLGARGYQDFAGSGVVHLTGGTCALLGAVFLGPRLGRFKNGQNKEIKGHSVPLAALGGFILIFGFLAFNGGSQASISKPGDGEVVALAIVNTILGCCCAGLTVLLLYKLGIFQGKDTSMSFMVTMNSALSGMGANKDLRDSMGIGDLSATAGKTPKGFSKDRLNWSFLMTLNGALTGMVALCAGCNAMRPWGAAVTGAMAGLVYLICHVIIPKMKVDDPLDAVAVHAGGGLWGLISVPLFKTDGGIVYEGTPESAMGLAWNLAGAASIIAWCAVICLIMFGTLSLLKLLRVDPEMEIRGLDLLKHNEPAYPAEAWVEEQYEEKKMSTVSLPDMDKNVIVESQGYLPPHMRNAPSSSADNGNYKSNPPYLGPANMSGVPVLPRVRKIPAYENRGYEMTEFDASKY